MALVNDIADLDITIPEIDFSGVSILRKTYTYKLYGNYYEVNAVFINNDDIFKFIECMRLIPLDIRYGCDNVSEFMLKSIGPVITGKSAVVVTTHGLNYDSRNDGSMSIQRSNDNAISTFKSFDLSKHIKNNIPSPSIDVHENELCRITLPTWSDLCPYFSPYGSLSDFLLTPCIDDVVALGSFTDSESKLIIDYRTLRLFKDKFQSIKMRGTLLDNMWDYIEKTLFVFHYNAESYTEITYNPELRTISIKPFNSIFSHMLSNYQHRINSSYYKDSQKYIYTGNMEWSEIAQYIGIYGTTHKNWLSKVF